MRNLAKSQKHHRHHRFNPNPKNTLKNFLLDLQVLEIAQGKEQSKKVSCGWSLEYWAQNFDIIWIWKVLGPVITVEAEQSYVAGRKPGADNR